ncbi:MAG: hypothetical protein HRT35_12900 [Algicola sp.]|nr:hypothetical protein [Algicola sp.]
MAWFKSKYPDIVPDNIQDKPPWMVGMPIVSGTYNLPAHPWAYPDIVPDNIQDKPPWMVGMQIVLGTYNLPAHPWAYPDIVPDNIQDTAHPWA